MAIDQNLAKRLLVEGGTFVFLNVPSGTEFGIDMKMWNTGEKFRGVKMIPPGIHFIHYSPSDVYGMVSPKVGFFHNFKRSEFLVRKWDKAKEDISLELVSQTEVVGLKDNIEALDQFLGPYPFDVWKKWSFLTSYITDSLISKLTPINGQVRSALDLVSCSDAERPRKARKRSGSKDDDDSALGSSPSSSSSSSNNRRTSSSFSDNDGDDHLLPELKPVPGTELRLTPFPDKNYPEGSTPSEITMHSLDSTYTLEVLLTQHDSAMDLIGELQFSYICFLVGHSLEAFEHWKKLVGLFCSCDKAIKKYRDLYDAFVTVLEVQLVEIPEEFLADIVSNNNFVFVKLRNLCRTMKESGVDGRLKTKVERFSQHLTSYYGWDFGHLDSDDEDEAPVIVET